MHACSQRLSGNQSVTGIDRDNGIELHEGFNDGHHTVAFLLGRNLCRARSSRLTAHVEYVSACLKHVLSGCDNRIDIGVPGVVEPAAAIRKGVGCDVEHTHDARYIEP